MTRGERLLVSSEEAPEGWVLAARAAEPAVVGYIPLTYVQKVPSATGFVEQERAHARRQEAEKAEAAAAAVYKQAKTKTGLQSAGQAVVNIVKACKGQAQAFAYAKKTRRIWPASAAQEADWPRLAASRCQPGHPLALVKPARSRRHSGRTLVDLVSYAGLRPRRPRSRHDPDARGVRKGRPGRSTQGGGGTAGGGEGGGAHVGGA